ncbi:MAG TPA: proton-conducting transporter membrane subunit [Tepidisphaeraceae bacterium]|nr:proton-conducting transporter membrane subunit [Tepidisphaeraceae bacterium]
MPTPALFLILATLLPLASFGLLLSIGRRMGQPLSGWIACAVTGAGFALSMAATIAWVSGGELAGITWGFGDKPIELAFRILPGNFGNLNIYIDTLTIAMFNTITPVAALVCLFGVRFLRDDVRFVRFFTYFQLLLFSMQALVLSGNLPMAFVFWELIALAGFMMSGREPSMRAFIFFRIGDAALLVGVVTLLRTLGNPTFLQMDRLVAASMIPARALAIAAPALACAALIKSLQFIFQPRLLSAAVLQTVSACAAAVYFLSRIFPLLSQAMGIWIAVVGLAGLIAGALLALRQQDIFRVLGWSTVSQFGLMFVAIGIGSWVGGLFHLLCHAFFKSLLILAAAAVVHATGGQRLPDLGGLVRRLPVVSVFFAIALLAMAPIPLTSGYYSSQLIFVHVGALAALRGGSYWLFFIIPAVAGALTGLYMTRCWMLIFFGLPRNYPLYERARERTSFWFPLGALAILSLVGGTRLMDIDRFVEQSAEETENYCNAMRDPGTPAFAAFTGPSARLSDDTGERLFHRYAIWPPAVGIAAGLIIYSRRRQNR